MEKARHPGIYKRGSRYVVVYHVDGRQRKESANTLEEARRLKAARTADRDRGEFQELSRDGFRDYAEEWIESYQGTGKRGFTENSRDDYRRSLELYAYPFFGARLNRTLAGITPRDVARWIAWLCDEKEQGRALADASVRRIVAPVRSCLGTAKREGLIRHNPADGAVLPHRPRIEDGEPRARALTREQLALFLEIAHPDYKLMFRLIAATGLRWSEVAALRWADFEFDGSRKRVKVRRAYDRGRFKAPKSEHGRQVQRWLGHHSPSFTLDTYVHLLDEGIGDGLDLEAETRQGGNRVATRHTGTHPTPPDTDTLVAALESQIAD
jgi:integrase